MTLKVDSFGKITVSLGGACKLWCKHCYITAHQFQHPRKRAVESVIDELRALAGSFGVVCISGDTDCFLDEDAGWALIEGVCKAFPTIDVMFTSRLVPRPGIVARISELAAAMAEDARFLVPCVSAVTWSYPNKVENPRLVPSTAERVAFLRQFADQGIPCFLALRPTFPFSVVSRDEVEMLLAQCGNAPACVLGEAFILDTANDIAARLGLAFVTQDAVVDPLTFLEQPGVWEKRIYADEIQFARERSHARGVPYFLRSMSAMRYLHEYWLLNQGGSTWRTGLPLDTSLEETLP
jgi:DNA repair photolyase